MFYRSFVAYFLFADFLFPCYILVIYYYNTVLPIDDNFIVEGLSDVDFTLINKLLNTHRFYLDFHEMIQ